MRITPIRTLFDERQESFSLLIVAPLKLAKNLLFPGCLRHDRPKFPDNYSPSRVFDNNRRERFGLDGSPGENELEVCVC